MSKHLGSDNHDQAKDHVDDRNAGEQARKPALDVMKDGQEPEVFVVQNLLLVWSCVAHERKRHYLRRVL